MRIALLTTDLSIEEWFQKTYPQVTLCNEVNDTLWQADAMIITSFYRIKGEHFQILNLWETFLRARQKRKRLALLGWSDYSSENYLKVANMPDLSDNWIRSLSRAGAGGEFRPRYPKLPESDITLSIGRVLHSHGERAFQKLLSKAQTPLRVVERAIREKQHRTYIQELSEMQSAHELMVDAKRVWDERVCYFKLMPQYRELRQFETLWDLWIRTKDTCISSSPRLSQQLGNYLQNTVINDIVRLYKIERDS